jgi:hypothetical protein
MSDKTVDEVFELALKLSIAEQARLLERVAANLAREVETVGHALNDGQAWTDEELAEVLKPATPKTGAEIAAMIESGELNADAWSEMINPHITDPVEWLKALRSDMSKKRNLDWDRE